MPSPSSSEAHPTMLIAVRQAAEWLSSQFLSEPDLRAGFCERLQDVLSEHYRGHWHPDEPHRGCAHRSLQYMPSTGGIDPLLIKAAEAAGVRDAAFFRGHNSEPDFVMWVNPGEVKLQRGRTQSHIWSDGVEPNNPYQKLRLKCEVTRLNVEYAEPVPVAPAPAVSRGHSSKVSDGAPANGIGSWQGPSPAGSASCAPISAVEGSVTPPSVNGESPTERLANPAFPPMMAPLPPQAGSSAFNAAAAPFTSAPALSAGAPAFSSSSQAFSSGPPTSSAAAAFSANAPPFNAGAFGASGAGGASAFSASAPAFNAGAPSFAGGGGQPGIQQGGGQISAQGSSGPFGGASYVGCPSTVF